ncbi:MAG: ABC transporter substrate-binding protein [Actinobacteria bacterium]|nr:ABC transporter substrate-binding protein [Actinomycetota bacterium]
MEDERLDELFDSRISRGSLLKRGAAAGAAVSLGGLLSVGKAFGGGSASLQTVRWISPRGSLQVMDDFNLWVPSKMGYFRSLGIEAKLIAGPIGDALASTKFVAQKKADMGYPSPGVLTASIDTGIDVKSVWDMISGQVFNFALPLDSKITSPKQLAGKRIALGSAGWQVIVDPMLVELGIDPKSVKYVAAGAQWTQAAATGKADAALAWEGLRAQLKGQGLKLKYLIGTTWSKLPSNVYSVRADDLQDAAKKDLYLRFLKGVVMGLEFTRANPRAAAQITYRSLPDLAKTLKPQLALDSMLELAHAYGTSHLKGQGYGYHYPGGWANYLKIIKDLGQTKKLLKIGDVYTNELAIAANKGANSARARADAKKFKLDSGFAATKVAPGFKM